MVDSPSLGKCPVEVSLRRTQKNYKNHRLEVCKAIFPKIFEHTKKKLVLDMKTTFLLVALKHFLVANIKTVPEQFESLRYLERFPNGANFTLGCNFENKILKLD
mgnify:CR=1 FL=1